VNGTEDYCRRIWVQNECGTVLHGNLKDVYGVNVKLNIVLLSHNRQEPVSWRIERIEEEGFCFIPTSTPPKEVNKLYVTIPRKVT
jgi:hypothetical protein